MIRTRHTISYIMLFLTLYLVSGQTFALGQKYNSDILKKGAKIAMEKCRLCHSFLYLRFSELEMIGMDSEEIDQLRGNWPQRAAIESFMSEPSSRALYGRPPVDLSLTAYAHAKGPQHIYKLLTSYFQRDDGAIINTLSPDTAMPDVLNISFAQNTTSRLALEDDAQAITDFLAWAADPKVFVRQTIGIWVLLYLVVLTLLLYLMKKKIWKKVAH